MMGVTKMSKKDPSNLRENAGGRGIKKPTLPSPAISTQSYLLAGKMALFYPLRYPTITQESLFDQLSKYSII